MSVITVILSNEAHLEGSLLQDGIRKFHVPYATVPKRWRAAKLFSPQPGTLDCRKLRQECPQPKDWFFDQEPRVGIVYDEFNCLNLDIVAPPPSKDGSLYPCMVWVHGGAFRNKAGGSDTYDATKFVQRSIEIGRPVVVVNVTHRLNVFGFFSSSEIQKEVQDDGEKVFGSWGIDDIAIGVQWIRQHISAFGGDPNRLTGFGQSAGSIILHHLLLKPDPLFNRVILQSGVQSVKPAVQPSHYDGDWNRIKKHFNATTVEDMRKVPATELAQTTFDMGVDFRPILDAAVAEDPLTQYKADGAYITLEALLIGDTTDEGTLWSRFGESNQIYQQEEKNIPAELLDRFHALYPPQALESKATAIPMLDQLLGERKFQCPIDRTVKAILDVQPRTELYRYRFDRYAEYTRRYGIEKHHGVELLYVFLNDALTPPELEVAKQMVGQWLAFAYGLDLESEAGWKRYDKTSKNCMVYGEEGNEVRSIEDTQDAEHYKFWEDVEECQSK